MNFEDFAQSFKVEDIDGHPHMVHESASLRIVIAPIHDGGRTLEGLRVTRVVDGVEEPIESVFPRCCLDHLVIDAYECAYRYYKAMNSNSANPRSPWIH